MQRKDLSQKSCNASPRNRARALAATCWTGRKILHCILLLVARSWRAYIQSAFLLSSIGSRPRPWAYRC